jgi:glycosyltransferase involved in cell wall biosynthesis
VRCIVLPHDPFAGANPLGAWRRIRRLARLIASERPNVIQSHLFPSNVAGRIAGWLADAPIRLSMNAGPYVLESPVLGEIDVRTARVDTRVIASCEYVRELYRARGVPSGRIALTYYGSNPARFNPARTSPAAVRASLDVGPDIPLVGMVAYFYPPSPDSPVTPPWLVGRGLKGHDVLLRAIPEVRARVADVRFVLVGEGWGDRGRAYEREVHALAHTLGVADRVIFTGYRRDVPDLLASFDVAVQCSLSENVGGAIEALMLGRPTVVSATGGLVDAVKHDITGLTVPPDNPSALADAIATLLVDRERADRLAGRGRAYALERFTVARTADDLDEVYAECARSPEVVGARGGYRPLRRFMRTLAAPVWALRLARPLLVVLAGAAASTKAGLIWFAVRRAAARVRDVAVALTALSIGSPYIAWHVVRYGRGRVFSRVMVKGSRGATFPLIVFTMEPRGQWLRRLPWFITMLATRQLALFGPTPVPYEPDAATARSDSRTQRPGIFDSAFAARGPAPAPGRRQFPA